jgi:thiol-disulfide isomerase/thioredoxin
MVQDSSASMEPTPGANDGDDAMDDDAAMDDVVVNEKLQFTAATLTGDAFDGTSLAGTDAILWFWASWCPTCQAEAPGIAQAAAQLPEGVTMYGVPGLSDQAGMEKFVGDYGLGDIVQIVDADGSLWSNFGVPSQPAFALINDNGEVTTIQGSLGLQGILDAANSLLDS